MIWEFAQLSFFGASDHQISHIYDDNLSLVEASIFWPQNGSLCWIPQSSRYRHGIHHENHVLQTHLRVRLEKLHTP